MGDIADSARHTVVAAEVVFSEQQVMTELTGHTAIPDYTGAADRLIDSALQRARHFIEDTP